jgi:cell division protein YceG involved in septum cleavage
MPGNTIGTILKSLSSRNQTKLKIYIKTHHVDFSQLEPGTYEFSGHYSKAGFIKTILAGPSNKYVKITVLE